MSTTEGIRTIRRTALTIVVLTVIVGMAAMPAQAFNPYEDEDECDETDIPGATSKCLHEDKIEGDFINSDEPDAAMVAGSDDNPAAHDDYTAEDAITQTTSCIEGPSAVSSKLSPLGIPMMSQCQENIDMADGQDDLEAGGDLVDGDDEDDWP